MGEEKAFKEQDFPLFLWVIAIEAPSNLSSIYNAYH
jgi:hypothetical protein